MSFKDDSTEKKDMSGTKKLQAPLSEDGVRMLKTGDEVLVSGVVYTARDMAHKRLCEAIYEGLDAEKR
jgi:fumarate hydratase subunit beta